MIKLIQFLQKLKVVKHIFNLSIYKYYLSFYLLFIVEDETSQCDTDSIIMTGDNDFINESPENVIIDVKHEFPIDNNLYLEEVIQEENEDDDFEWKEDDRINIIEENVLEDSSSAIDETIALSSGSEKSDKKSDKRSKKRQNKKGSSRSGERACLPAIHGCALCGKKWRTVTELKSHIQSHSSLRPFVCEVLIFLYYIFPI